MSVADRHINPLGFKVLRYRRSAETLPPEPKQVIEPQTPAEGEDLSAAIPTGSPLAPPSGAAGAEGAVL